MKLVRSIRFERTYAQAPKQVQRAFDKQSLLLTENLHHPSLRAKKYDESRDLWLLFLHLGRCLFHRGHYSASKVKWGWIRSAALNGRVFGGRSVQLAVSDITLVDRNGRRPRGPNLTA
jgi:hypothetical protein